MTTSRWTAAILSLLLAAPLGAAKAPKFKPNRPYVEGEIVVQFKQGPESFEARETNAKLGGTVLKVHKELKLALIQLPPGLDTVKGIERYRKEPAVLAAEPNYIVSQLRKPAPKPKKAGKKPAPKQKSATPAPAAPAKK